MDKAPIVLFCYNRPDHTRRLLESLKRCEGAGESTLYIYVDGPKGEGDLDLVSEVRSIARDKEWCREVHVVERESNMGLARSIIGGVTEALERDGRVIVLEDDLELSPHFLDYMNGALDYYKDNDKVMHVSGYSFPPMQGLADTFFYRATSCWGWGTWKRAWAHFEADGSGFLKKLKSKERRFLFDIDGSYDYYGMLEAQVRGKVDSWAIRWYASVFFSGGLCLHPGRSMVNNRGNDGTGVHCSSTDVFDVSIGGAPIRDFTDELAESREALQAMVRYNVGLRPTFAKRLIDFARSKGTAILRRGG